MTSSTHFPLCQTYPINLTQFAALWNKLIKKFKKQKVQLKISLNLSIQIDTDWQWEYFPYMYEYIVFMAQLNPL